MCDCGALGDLLKTGCKQFYLDESRKIIKLNSTQVEEQENACSSHLSSSNHVNQLSSVSVSILHPHPLIPLAAYVAFRVLSVSYHRDLSGALSPQSQDSLIHLTVTPANFHPMILLFLQLQSNLINVLNSFLSETISNG